ncbi:MAG TPA: prepilin-type N-terminal cleavage/methylation domain-containing protein [Conexibacter sp.]|nr:prepilin-type N-terminal cleavage/methylation domain-containing protein [Conexibacter sp.]
MRNRIKDERGFTLIELLVVILIIGILAAIAIPSFISQKDKAGDASAKSYARNMQTAQETYFTDNNTYANSLAALQRIEPALNTLPNPARTPTATGGINTWRVTAISQANVSYSIDRAATGAISRSCLPRDTGGCNSTGTW